MVFLLIKNETILGSDLNNWSLDELLIATQDLVKSSVNDYNYPQQ